MILLNFGWMVDLAMSIFEFLTKFLVLWHPWHPWVCIRSVCWKCNLKQIEAIPPSVQALRAWFLVYHIFSRRMQCLQNENAFPESISPHYASLGRRILFSRVRKVVSEMKRTINYHKVWIKCKITQLLSWILNVTLYTLGGVKSACKDPSFAQSLVILQIRRGNFQNGLFRP